MVREKKLLEHKAIFGQPVEKMVRKRNPQYLLVWVNIFDALVLLSDRKTRGAPNEVEVNEELVATFDTWIDEMDLEKYLVDTTDEMEWEWDIMDEMEV